MRKNKTIYNFLCLIIIALFFEGIKSDSDNENSDKSYEIHIYFQSNGFQSLYCDDNIKLFGTDNIQFYKIKENGVKININSLLRQDLSSHSCNSLIKYNIDSVKEKIIIEFKDNPKTLRKLFSESNIYKIERFDYPFPIDQTHYNEMFYECNELTSVDFRNFNFENTTDVSNMFNYCKNLETIIFPENSKSSRVEKFIEMFAHAESVTSLDLSFFSFVEAKNMAYMFNGCKNLKYIEFPKNEKAEKVQFLNDMFGDCPSLTSVDLSNFSFKNVENMAYMFNGCNKLSTLILPTENDTSTALQDIKYLFYDCKELTSIDLSGISFLKINDLSFLFHGCENLETLILPSDGKASNVIDFSYMFFDCIKLTTVDLSNISFINSQKLSFMFFNCSNLTNVKFPIEEKATKVEIFQYMFYYCQSLVSVDLSNFSFVKAKILNSMFFYCTNLENIILPKDEIATNIEDISYMFFNCNKLRNIDLSGISLTNVIDMSFIFSFCTNLENIKFANDQSINNIEEISYAFASCYNLKSIDLSKFNINLVTDLEYLFYSCSSLETIILPEHKIYNIESFFHTFDNCSKLKTINLNNISFLNANNIGFMFSNCSDLLEIKFDKNEQVLNINNMDGAFANCTSLISIDLRHIYINNNVTLDNLFLNCHSLKEINLFNIDTTKSSSTFNFLNNDNLEKCSYYNLDNIHLNTSSVFKPCSQSIFFHKCGSCINTDNLDEYCTINVNNKNLNFYFFKSELNLLISEKQCLWTNNSDNFEKYIFINNSNINEKSYFDIYCDNYCEICSDNEYGCTKCKSNLFPIDTEYTKYINNETSYFYCYEKMEAYFFDEGNQQFIKCSEKCSECSNGTDICNKCNEEKKYYPVENMEGECWNVSQIENYFLDEGEVKQWKKCHERCSECKKQSKSELEHQCEKCSNNYYPYLIDYQNFKNLNLTGFSCWSIDEVKSKNRNYFLNNLNQFEQCDISCAECETTKDNCIACQINFYYINGHKNGTCFHYPLRKYALSNIDEETVFLSCFDLCEYCNKVSQSFLYQQCSKCDEIDYTLDEYSLDQSYCIPKDKSNSYIIKYQTKWYIKDFKGMENLIIENKNMILDYQRILNDEIYNNLEYEIVEECPTDKPYVIYSTRQCVSSCNSSNLIEFGIFMTKQLYLYNNICYDKCPYGSIENNETFTCIEINEYLINQSISVDYFKKYISSENILKYLGDGYAKDTIQVTRAPDFSNYLSNETHDSNYDEQELIQKKKEIKMPIYDFSECISKLRKHYNFNESENIFSEIIEYNDVVYKNGTINHNVVLNSTSFRFFLNNGSIINHSICKGVEIIVMKIVNNINFNLTLVEKIKEMFGIDIFEYNYEANNACAPIISDIDLLNENKKPCDKDGSFISFDSETNYSTCKYKILSEEQENDIMGETKDQIQKWELVETFLELLKRSNLKHISCFNSIKASHVFSAKGIWIPLIIFLSIIAEIVFFVIILWVSYKKILILYINKKREAKSGNIISEKTHLIDQSDDEEELLSEDYGSARKIFGTTYSNNLIKYFGKTYWAYLKNNIIIFIFNISDKSEFNSKSFKFIKLIISSLNYLFITALLFNDNYISVAIKVIQNELEQVLTKELRRIIFVFIITQFLNEILSYFFNSKENLEENDKYFEKRSLNNDTVKEYYRQINYLKCCFEIKLIIGFIFILIFHITIIYYFTIFTSIYSDKNYQLYLFIYFLLTIFLYILLNLCLFLIIAVIRLLALKYENCFMFKISVHWAK